ncbi:AraC family transcriptional regulator [Mycobacterium alsense]|uniref:AraC family transcriptional regulator n=1 Tax=Mycobacterium alsense TaxID=324058 RepID=A0AA42C306_9MYCO|nr:helix-turn-helix transcriptional regulator [Mycobacterium alsense]MCV7381789.1 helix-turn-helix transcriptional regulator [Mycobacterium alsense]OQZ88585.1 AraC family transcriptional regulator [Mycobacterium alsense]
MVTLVARPHFSLQAWTCRPDAAGWSAVERPIDARLVLVRSGRFRRRASHGPVDLDRTVGYVGAPGERDQFAHPHGGDAGTSVRLSAAAWWRLVGDPGRLRRPTFYVDARLELAHRRLLVTRAATDVDYQLAEDLVALAVGALRSVTDRHAPLNDRPAPADARLVRRARAAIHDDHPAARGLFPLAELLGASPYRLSRAFPRELGVTLTRYRNRVRVGRALDRLQRGESTLAGVAAELGFADQAHFSRVAREHLGHTPAALRRELGAGPPPRRR